MVKEQIFECVRKGLGQPLPVAALQDEFSNLVRIFNATDLLLLRSALNLPEK